jgi:ABC-type Mn2+/Zn2+ transport system permease subunit
VLDPFTLPYVQRGVLEVLVLSVGAGVLGTFIVVRGLAFFSHAVAGATFPGLVLADGIGFAAALGAIGTGLLFALGLAPVAARRREGHDTLTALLLVAALAGGVILASDVYHSGSAIESQLFGSLLLIGPGDVRLAAVASAVTVLAAALLGRRWVAAGFDPEAARASGLRSPLPGLVLLALIALESVAALNAIGALLASALLVVPAVTVRPWVTGEKGVRPLFHSRMATWQVATVVLAAAEGVAGLWLSVQTDAPPGATVAVLAGGVFAVGSLARPLVERARTGPIPS